MAKYLGVPVRTYIKWENGTRAPVAVVARVLDILDMMQANAPALHDELLRQARHKP
jgi:DNA-binding transcriptional regulator YiaG